MMSRSSASNHRSFHVSSVARLYRSPLLKLRDHGKSVEIFQGLPLLLPDRLAQPAERWRAASAPIPLEAPVISAVFIIYRSTGDRRSPDPILAIVTESPSAGLEKALVNGKISRRKAAE